MKTTQAEKVGVTIGMTDKELRELDRQHLLNFYANNEGKLAELRAKFEKEDQAEK